MAIHLVRINTLELSETSAEAFIMLEHAKVISPALAHCMRNMVGVLNIVGHNYRALDWNLLRKIVRHNLADMHTFALKLVVC